MRHGDIFFDWRQRRLIPIYLEQFLSICWAAAWMALTIIVLVHFITAGRFYYPVFWSGTYLALICIVQFLVAMTIPHCT